MSRPDLPKSLDGGKSEARSLAELVGILVGAWEVGYLVLLLSGNGPQGQIWSVPFRWITLWQQLAMRQSYPGGWMAAEWGVAHTIALVPVVLVSVGMVLVVAVAVHLMDHGLPERGPRRKRPQRNTKLDDWLRDQANRKDD